MNRFGLLCIVFIFIGFGCSSVSTTADFDSSYDFGQLKKFAWLPQPSDSKMSPLVFKRIKNAVVKELTAKGFEADSENPDFVIATHGAKQTKTDIESWGYGWGRWGRRRWGGVEVTQYKQGTLVLDFVDAKQKDLIWRGTGSSVLPDNPSPEKVTEIVNKSVAQILEKFPPAN